MLKISEEQIEKIAIGANGDARRALTLLELIVQASSKNEDDEIEILDETIADFVHDVGVYGDKKGSLFIISFPRYKKVSVAVM